MAKATRTGMRRLNSERQTLSTSAILLEARGEYGAAKVARQLAAEASKKFDAMHREVWAREEAARNGS